MNVKAMEFNGDLYILENVKMVSKIDDIGKYRPSFSVIYTNGASLNFVKGVSEEDTGIMTYDKSTQIRVFQSLEDIRNDVVKIVGEK